MEKKLIMLYLDLPGVVRGVEIPYSPDTTMYRTFFDASSVYGFEEVYRSDLMLALENDRVKRLPWSSDTFAGIASINYPSGERYVKDPRLVAERLEGFLKQQGLKVFIGVELELFLFKNVVAEIHPFNQYVEINAWDKSIVKYPIPPRRGYQVVEPVDYTSMIRDSIINSLENIGFPVVKAHHEVSSCGQIEITLKPLNLVDSCDSVVWAKYVSRKIASLYNYVAVYLPKPVIGENGSGLHIHISLYNGEGKPLFKNANEHNSLSDTARYFIGGLIEHGRSLSAIVSPTTNSYRRLIPGYEAPTILAWGFGNRSVAVRIPYSNNGVERIEYRPPDPLMNPYLGISAILLAGLNGVQRKLEPPPPLLDNAYEYSSSELLEKGYKLLPRNLEEALDELESDHEYLKPMFSNELIESYIEIKRREIREQQGIPSPIEYLYYMHW